jgi:hypothetical protein
MAKKSLTQDEATKAAKALEVLFASSYIDKKKLYKENFIRGLTFGMGSLLGATVGVALLLWFISLFAQVPLLGDFVQNVEQTISQNK